MFTSRSSGMPFGVTNAADWQTMARAGLLDPTWAQTFAEDFNQYVAGAWSLTGVGTPAAALAAGQGGLLNLATTAANGDTSTLQLPVAGFQATPGKPLFFKFKWTPVASASSDVLVGLAPVGASPLTAADGLFFLRATGQSQWIFRSRIGGVNTDTPLPATCLSVDGTAEELGFFIDQQGNIAMFWNPTTGPNSPINAAAGAPRGRVASLQNTPSFTNSLTQVLLSPTVSIKSNTAAAKNATLDFLVVSSER